MAHKQHSVKLLYIASMTASCYAASVVTIAVLSQKGGVGKTMLVCNLAVAAARARLKAGIVDTDPQASATAWGDARTEDEPVIVSITPGEIASVLATARAEALDVVLVDSAPRASVSLTNLATEADFALIPLLPSGVDVATAEQSAAIAIAAGKPFAFVLNECPVGAPEILESREVLAELGPVLTAEIGQRRAFGRAFSNGKSVLETEQAPKAARDEITALWDELWSRVNAH